MKCLITAFAVSMIFFLMTGASITQVYASSTTLNSDSLIRVVGISVADIVVDGSLSDWTNISPSYVDVTGDSIPQHSGCDLKNIYIATNSVYDILYIALEMTESLNDEDQLGGGNPLVQYCIQFDDFGRDSSGSCYYDWQIGIDKVNNFWTWDLSGDNDYDDMSNMTWYDSSSNTITEYKQNDIIEFSFPISIIALPDSFAIRAYLVLRDGQNTNADWMDGDLVLTFDPSAFSSAINNISSPSDLLDWMKENITYGWPGYPDMSTWIYKAPDEVFYSKKGECASQSGFEAYVLGQIGYQCNLLWVERTNYSDHAVCYWEEADGFHYMEHAFHGFEGLYGPFESVESIGADVCNHLSQDDGYQECELFSMRNVEYGANWNEFREMIEPLKTADEHSDIPTEQDVSIWDDPDSAPIQIDDGTLTVDFSYSVPVVLMVGVMNPDDNWKSYWLQDDCSRLAEPFNMILTPEFHCTSVPLPISSGYVFWMISPISLGDLNWTTDPYHLHFYAF